MRGRHPRTTVGEILFSLGHDRTDTLIDTLARYNISEPFNFQHLTHTEPVQYKRMEEASPNDFVSEFSALRASQAPRRELQGIKADNIILRDEAYVYESESEMSSPARSIGEPVPRPASEAFGDHLSHRSYTPSSPLQNLHHAISIDSISNISPILPRDATSPSPSTSTPKTRQPFSPNFFPDNQYSLPLTEAFPTFQDADCGGIESPEYPTSCWNAGVDDFVLPHAVTTPDDEAHTLRPPPFHMVRTELCRVLEEDECSEGRRSIATVRPSTPSSTGLLLRPSRSFPNLRHQQHPLKGGHAHAHAHAHAQSVTLDNRTTSTMIRPSSIFEQVSSDIPEGLHACELAAPLKEQDSTWEDAIDYCYDNEAEANCNFDWHHDHPPLDHADHSDLVQIVEKPFMPPLKTTLLPCPAQVQISHRSSSIYSMLPSSARLPHRAASSIYSPSLPPPHTPARFPQRASSIYSAAPTLIVPSPSFASVPDLDPSSAVSGSSSLDSVEALTPREEESPPDLSQQILTATCKPTCQDWTDQTPSPPTDDPESIMVYEDLYHVIYARKSQPEPAAFDFGQLDGSTISSISPRSSRTSGLISKKSSQESVWSSFDRRHNRTSSSSAGRPDFAGPPCSSSSTTTTTTTTEAEVDLLKDRLYALEATVTCADAGQAAASRRRSRSRSVAREAAAARHAVRSKVLSQDGFISSDLVDVPMPSYPN